MSTLLHSCAAHKPIRQTLLMALASVSRYCRVETPFMDDEPSPSLKRQAERIPAPFIGQHKGGEA